jgi:hypothetical protein
MMANLNKNKPKREINCQRYFWGGMQHSMVIENYWSNEYQAKVYWMWIIPQFWGDLNHLNTIWSFSISLHNSDNII